MLLKAISRRFTSYGIENCVNAAAKSYSTKAKTFHEALFDDIKDFRKKGEERSFKPAKLHMVKRIKPIAFRPYWEKLLIRKIGLEEEGAISIVKNTPNVNKILWEIKHLISVKPITFPNGPPKEGDYSGTYLKRNGELLVSEKLKVDPQKLLLDPGQEKSKLDGETLKREMRRRWHT